MAGKESIVAVGRIESLIHLVRGQRVILDSDLAGLYGVETRTLNQAVKRNIDRFPEDFMFQLAADEDAALRSQFVISKKGRGGRRYLPYAFTEHGAIMAASVLNTAKAVEVSVYVVRAFVRLRDFVSRNKRLEEKLSALEAKLSSHDDKINSILVALRQLMRIEGKPRRRIGFHHRKDDD